MRLQARTVRQPVEARRRAPLCFAACQREIVAKSIELQQSPAATWPRTRSNAPHAVAEFLN
jgi:hypothetical protein